MALAEFRGGGTGPGIIIFDGCRWWEDCDLGEAFSGRLGSWGAGSEVIGGGGGVCGGEAISIIGSGIGGCDGSGSKYAASGKSDCEGGGMGGTLSSDVVLGGNITAPSRYASLEGGGVIDGALLSARDVGDEGSSATSLKPSRYIEIASSTLMPSSIP